jgi:hypothetical protein
MCWVDVMLIILQSGQNPLAPNISLCLISKQYKFVLVGMHCRIDYRVTIMEKISGVQG